MIPRRQASEMNKGDGGPETLPVLDTLPFARAWRGLMRYLSWPDCLAEKPFVQIIDVRSPEEFALDHVPGAVNLPVLNDAERAEVGQLYCKVSRYVARRLGAAMIARRVAGHLDTFFAPYPEHARFLLYCWRGGQRSRAMATILHAVGWNVTVLAGGYKNYRAHVREALTRLCPTLRVHILTGLTGSGKSRLLRHMSGQGQQVLDLEMLGCHRGSLLGEEPGTAQPSQKRFESLLLREIDQYDTARPVWIEDESKRLGRLWLPEPLWEAMVAAPVHELCVPSAARAEFLVEEYAHFIAAPNVLIEKLQSLRELCGGRLVAAWQELIRAGEWRKFVLSLLERHYDPVYLRCRNLCPGPCSRHEMPALDAESLDRAAAALIAAAE